VTIANGSSSATFYYKDTATGTPTVTATRTSGMSLGSDTHGLTVNAQGLTVTTQAVSGIGTTTATGNGNITDLGSPDPTQHGVCWNTTGSPTIGDSKTEEGPATATGPFTSSMTGLSPNTTYYVRAYATNASGTSYGNQVSFNSSETLPTGTPSSYKITVTKVELYCYGGSSWPRYNRVGWIRVFSGTSQLDVKAGGTFPGIGDLGLPIGTYSEARVTFNNSFLVTGTLSYGGTAYYTTATTFGGQTNLASTPTTVAGSMAEFTFYNPAWGALNSDVMQTYSITPFTVGPTTDYLPTLRFTISNTLHLKGSAGDPSSYYFSLDAPTVSLVEP